MRAHDITFVMKSGDHNGAKYGFTLAQNDGKKAWRGARVFYPPPSMIREKIDIVVTAREANISLSGAQELKLVDKILENLEVISNEEEVTLIGFDRQERTIRVDKEAATVTPVVHERDKEPEYQVAVTCWGLYE